MRKTGGRRAAAPGGDRVIERQLGDEHPTVGQALNELGGLLVRRGAFEEAERVIQRSIAVHRRAFGEDGSLTILSKTRLADLFRAKGEPMRALELLEGLLPRAREAVGEDDFLFYVFLGSLAGAEQACGRPEDALRHMREVVEGIHRLRPGSPSEIAALGDLAQDLFDLARVDEAVTLYAEAIEGGRRVLGPRNTVVATWLSGYAFALQAQNRHDEAVRAYEESMGILRETLDPEALRLGELSLDMLRLGRLVHLQQSEAEEELCRRILEVHAAVLGEDRWEVANHRLTLGLAFQSCGLLEDAEGQYRAAHECFLRIQGEQGTGTYQALNRLALVLIMKGESAPAEELLRRLLTHEREMLPAGHPGLAPRLALLGLALLAKEDFAGAEPVLRECLEIREKAVPDHWLRWNAASLLGGALSGQGKFAEAEPLLIEGYEKMDPPDQPMTRQRKREAMERIVKLYEAWGKPEKAAEWRAKLEAGGESD